MVAAADDACASYAAAMISNTERDHAKEMPDWKYKCERHPIKVTCEDTLDTVQEARHISPLHCVGGPPKR